MYLDLPLESHRQPVEISPPPREIYTPTSYGRALDRSNGYE